MDWLTTKSATAIALAIGAVVLGAVYGLAPEKRPDLALLALCLIVSSCTVGS